MTDSREIMKIVNQGVEKRLGEVAAAIHQAVTKNTAQIAPEPTLPDMARNVMAEARKALTEHLSLLVRYNAGLNNAIESVQRIRRDVERSKGRIATLCSLLTECLDHFDPLVDNEEENPFD